jgi:hypothetical protein
MKRSLLCLLCLCLLVSACFVSCGLDYRASLDENLHNQVDLVYDENDQDVSHVVYKGKTYTFFDSTDFLSINTKNANTLLSWNGHRYVGYVSEYYSYTLEEPLFIYYKSWVFLREDYDYKADMFVIKNSSAEIVWKNIFGTEQTRFNFQSPITVELYSKQCSRIKATLELEYVEDHWYVSVPGSQSVWILSDEFAEMLSQSGVI